MSKFFFGVIMMLILGDCKAQITVGSVCNDSLTAKGKPCIDSTAYDKWPVVESARISNNGKYMVYKIVGGIDGRNTTVLKECEGSWELRMTHMSLFQFTADNRMAIGVSKDTLFIVKLGTSFVKKIPAVKSVDVPVNGNGEWIMFETTTIQELVLYNLRTTEFRTYKSVESYILKDDGKTLILQLNEDNVESLYRIEMSNGIMTSIWKGRGLQRLVINQSASQFSFLISDSSNNKSIWYYKIGDKKASPLISSESLSIDSSMVIDNLSKFSKDSKYIFFTIKRREDQSSKRKEVSSTNVWSYLDEKLQSAQISEGNIVQSYSSIVNLANRHITRLEFDNEWILGFGEKYNVFLVEHKIGNVDMFEGNWNCAAQSAYYIKFTNKASEEQLKIAERSMINLSPEGKFVVYYDKKEASYIAYEVASGKYRNVTSGVNVSWIDYNRDDVVKVPRGIVGWLEGDAGVLLYDRFDIWLVDLLGKNPPRNLTNGFGLKHSIIFNIGLNMPPPVIFRKKDTLILNALNIINKQNGYFRKVINISGDPDQLTMDNCIYQLINNSYVDNTGTFPIKCRDNIRSIVMRMKANESPNYFFTGDFRKFVQLSNVYPEREYNWYNTELHAWKKPNGSILQGVLYKPDNFDSTKRYPVIFTYYEKKSFTLNEYLSPEVITNGCNINIPTFVSNGYLVFAADVDFVVGDPMQGTYDAIVSAAKYLSEFSFVDKGRMGIGGCSFGGLQTNYLVTHSDLFAAAYSSSSMSDMISAYGDTPARNRSLQSYFESGQARMGATLWEKPEMYIKNSAIFNADKVTTPLLLMHTTDDGIYSFAQAVEFFTALRRLGKRAWLLEYPGNHGIYGELAKDFSVRISQFFDHYLKGKAAPKWMTRGISAKLKGIDNGYKLDYEIKTPGKGLLKDSI